MSIFQTGELMNVVHRHPSLLHKMVVTETKLITASPERPGTISVLSYWWGGYNEYWKKTCTK